jgi:hypothetical protein
MSDRYYYLLAQLPALRFGREPGIAVSAFLAEADKWLGRRDAAILRRAALYDVSPEPSGCRFLDRSKDFERGFRLELAEWRRARREGREMRTSFPPGLVREGTPLEIERKLLGWRWDRLEEEEQGHHFDLEAAVAYALKLQIAARLAVYDEARGLRAYRNLTGRASDET